MHRSVNIVLILVLCGMLLLVACGGDDDAPTVALPTLPAATTGDDAQAIATVASSDDAAPVPTDTPIPTPTPTPIPLAALVNGEPILLETYSAELERDQLLNPDAPGDARVRVFERLISERLIQQEAIARGISVTDADVDARINEQIAEVGETNYQGWLANNRLTEASYRVLLANELWSLKLRETLGTAIPYSGEARQASVIETLDRATADQAYAALQAGTDFVSAVLQYSVNPQKETTNGDIGIFSRGGLFIPAIADQAYLLEVGQYSPVFEAQWPSGRTAYFIVQTTRIESDYTYAPEERNALVESAFGDTLAAARDNAALDVYVGFD